MVVTPSHNMPPSLISTQTPHVVISVHSKKTPEQRTAVSQISLSGNH
nr:MAG TPA: hypothetical protein [Caudoviricetes sp.]